MGDWPSITHATTKLTETMEKEKKETPYKRAQQAHWYRTLASQVIQPEEEGPRGGRSGR